LRGAGVRAARRLLWSAARRNSMQPRLKDVIDRQAWCSVEDVAFGAMVLCGMIVALAALF
jgi:hypothetical protein